AFGDPMFGTASLQRVLYRDASDPTPWSDTALSVACEHWLAGSLGDVTEFAHALRGIAMLAPQLLQRHFAALVDHRDMSQSHGRALGAEALLQTENLWSALQSPRVTNAAWSRIGLVETIRQLGD